MDFQNNRSMESVKELESERDEWRELSLEQGFKIDALKAEVESLKSEKFSVILNRVIADRDRWKKLAGELAEAFRENKHVHDSIKTLCTRCQLIAAYDAATKDAR